MNALCAQRVWECECGGSSYIFLWSRPYKFLYFFLILVMGLDQENIVGTSKRLRANAQLLDGPVLYFFLFLCGGPSRLCILALSVSLLFLFFTFLLLDRNIISFFFFMRGGPI